MLFTDDYFKKGFHTLEHHKWTHLQYNVQMKVRRLPPSICQEHTEVIYTWHSFSISSLQTKAASDSQHALVSVSVGGLQLPVLWDFRLAQKHNESVGRHICALPYTSSHFLWLVRQSQTCSPHSTPWQTPSHTHTLPYAPGAEQFWCMMQSNDAILQPQLIL